MTPPSSEPQRQMITADAVLLAAQNERIDRLVSSIEQLTAAVSHRPTRHDLESTRRRLRNQVIATMLSGLVLFALVGANFLDLREQCQDRNANTVAFRTLLIFLVEETDKPGSNTDDALSTYLDTLVPVNC